MFIYVSHPQALEWVHSWLLLPQISQAEGTGQQFGETRFLLLVTHSIRNEHHRIQPKLGQHLAAGTAGCTSIANDYELALE